MVLECVVVVVRLCPLYVVPRCPWERWQGLVRVVVVSVVHVMVWCGPVRRLGSVACRGRLRRGVVLMELVGVALVLRHQGLGVGGGEGVLMMLVVPRSQVCVNGGPCAAWIRAGSGLWPSTGGDTLSDTPSRCGWTTRAAAATLGQHCPTPTQHHPNGQHGLGKKEMGRPCDLPEQLQGPRPGCHPQPQQPASSPLNVHDPHVQQTLHPLHHALSCTKRHLAGPRYRLPPPRRLHPPSAQPGR